MGTRPFSMTLSPNLFLFLGFCFSLSLSLSFFFTRHVSLLLFLMEILYCFFDNFSVLIFMIRQLLCSASLFVSISVLHGLRSGILYLSLFFSWVQRDWTLLWEAETCAGILVLWGLGTEQEPSCHTGPSRFLAPIDCYKIPAQAEARRQIIIIWLGMLISLWKLEGGGGES